MRLVGQVDEVDQETGEVRESFSTDDEPDGILLKACGNRRASRCPSCSELVRTCWRLGAEPPLAALGLRRWAHMLGFRGHWSTKSRRYSTTFTALRRARVEHVKRRLLDPWGRPATEGATVPFAEWRYAGRGYRNAGDAWLAASAAADARERRRIAREELTTSPQAA